MRNSPDTHPIIVIFLTLITVLIGFVIIGSVVLGPLVAMPFFDGSITEFMEALQNIPAHPELKIPLYIMQGCATFVGLIVGPALLQLALRRSVTDFFRNDRFNIKPVVLTILIVIVFVGINSFFIEWNSKLSSVELFEL